MSWPPQFDHLSGYFKDVWNLPLYNAGDTTVELNQLIVAVIIIIAGWWLAKRFARLASKRLEQSAHIGAATAYVIQKTIAYFLYLLTVIIALPFAGIPVTIFAVLGGALAIGVGFGAQNLINNLISGLILLIERPIRIGDTVELENERGRVEDIGNRCVRLRRFDGVYVLVPNSHFLEQRVANWTLLHSDVRGTVDVGVAYGSPTQQVRQLLLQAAAEQNGIDHEPEPEVLFDDFGDNALNFSLLFWARVSAPIDLRRIQSTLRFRIDELFREHGICIAFPQRDVHLDARQPLRIQLQQEEKS